MFGITDTMPITFKAFVVSNSTIDFLADGGMKRRIKTLQFDSEFIDDLQEENIEKCLFKKDGLFGKKLQNEYKHSLLELIFDYSKKFIDNKLKLELYPKEWNEENNDVLQSNNKFMEWFENTFEINPDYKINRPIFEDALKKYNGSIKFKDEVKKNKLPFKYESQERFESSARGVWYGFRLIQNEE